MKTNKRNPTCQTISEMVGFQQCMLGNNDKITSFRALTNGFSGNQTKDTSIKVDVASSKNILTDNQTKYNKQNKQHRN
ncbi:UNKNOWN [Stylonychia lemnae]|uniref:Uncharacterized protein n=1 Tax=Stylonychia lemnae TaxID=5949 RepID=A0A078AJ59_STYLE|nr:UNKNOWN [Stylonychia lemnae]|eukprot:CDW81931.1 UNKNOWN [Stylonychia lemnae]